MGYSTSYKVSPDILGIIVKYLELVKESLFLHVVPRAVQSTRATSHLRVVVSLEGEWLVYTGVTIGPKT